jgi:hypothetical protein
MCDLDPVFGTDPQIKAHDTIKPFSRIINNPVVNYRRSWTESNCLILDDSARKLRFNPKSTQRIVSWDESLLEILNEPFFENWSV